MDEKTWTIVQFVDDSTVEAVPSTWVQGDLCHWPSFSKMKLYNAIRKSEPLNTCWPSHKVKIFRNATFDDYGKARLKAKVAETKSDLDTGENDQEYTKRKRVQKILSSSESNLDSSGEISLPLPPKVKKSGIKEIKGKNQESRSSETSSTQNQPGKNQESQSSETSSTQNQPGKNQESQSNKTSSTKNQPETVMVDTVEDIFTKRVMEKDQGLEIKIDQKVEDLFNKRFTEKDQKIKILMEQNHILRCLISETLSEVRKVRSDLKQDEKRDDDPSQHFFTKYQNMTFPIHQIEDFDKLETLLLCDKDFENAVKEISKLGGSNTYNFIKRSMATLITNDIALKFSYYGRKGKKPFNNTKLLKLIIAAAEKAKVAKSQAEVEGAVATWLRRASDRRSTIQKKF